MSVVRIIGRALLVCLFVAGVFRTSTAAAAAEAPPFILLDAMPPEVVAEAPWVRPDRYQAFMLDRPALVDALRAAPLEDTAAGRNAPLFFALPMPDGSMRTFKVVESPIQEPALAAKFPDARTYMGQGIDEHGADTVRFSVTELGLHAQVLSPDGAVYIDPFSKGDTVFYTSHYKRDLSNPHQGEWRCDFESIRQNLGVPARESGGGTRETAVLVERRTYRLANACTGEYAAFFGGTQAQAHAAIVAAINRVTGVYETELGIRLTLVGNNNLIEYTNGATDPYTNNNGSTMLSQNQSNLTSVIGTANYDIGHVFSTGGGGVAGLGVVCVAANKAWGVTGLGSPTGDAFYIDYVAHEMGHQFGGNHNFNSPSGSCNGNRNSSTAYECGSASTIMGYAGICAPDNLQSHSDPVFGFISLSEIAAYTRSGGGGYGCAQKTTSTNNAPTCSAGGNFTVPCQTPFTLTAASAADADGNTLTYSWEERDLGPAATLAAADNGTSPIMRPLPPVTSSSRTFPRLSGILNGTNATTGEKLPSVARTMRFRLTVRDNVAGNGGFATSDMQLSVVNTGAAFQVTSPNTNVSWSGAQTVTWNVAGTTANGINCASVNILLSTDGGTTFPTVLLANAPNTGSATVTLPNTATTQARIKVAAAGNVFFDISNTNFTITSGPPATPTNIQATPSTICFGQSAQLSASSEAGTVVYWWTGSCGGTFVASGSPISVSPGATTTYYCSARRTSDNAVSSCGTVTVTVNALPAAPSGASSNRSGFCATDAGTITLTAAGGSGATLRWFSGACGGVVAGTGNNLVLPSPTVTTTYYARWENSCGNSSCVPVTVSVTPSSDYNGDTTVDDFDYFDFLNAFNANSPSADFNGDTTVDDFDLFDFLNAFAVNC
ncbi:MAG: hypothetical protein JNM07_09500 [Phycisphaerae bacterium]|nr:hypothetical protein [Phycisphaerae bacterium]